MRWATISEAKNKLSEYLAEVRAGETLVILDRKRPVARVEAIREAGELPGVDIPGSPWAPAELLKLPIGSRAEVAVSRAVSEERESGW